MPINRPKWNCKMQTFFRLRSIFLGTIFFEIFKVYCYTMSMIVAVYDYWQRNFRSQTCFFQYHFVYLHEISHPYLYELTAFSSPQKSRKTVFLQPNPVCDFDPWFYDFGETVMITGSGLKKSYLFRFCVFFSFFWCNDFDVSYTVFVRFFLVTGFFAYFPVATFSSFSFSL